MTFNSDCRQNDPLRRQRRGGKLIKSFFLRQWLRNKIRCRLYFKLFYNCHDQAWARMSFWLIPSCTIEQNGILKNTCGLYSKLFYICHDDHKSDATIRSVILELSFTFLEVFFTTPEASFMMFILQTSPTIICDCIMFMVQTTEVFFAVKFFQCSLHRLLMEYGTVSFSFIRHSSQIF